ncbi:hypothetical protein DUI87_08916 [Hirundo rustica rustica]|uniref:Uncharacterized protein n=1 Tax=Hirundo rustica rustica TaxID=333673 RepID=A0A3M0KL59_HIRRU|nr:hypothetical protein DUI87_08916 [Hirundo rustica rustica]
MSELEKRYWVWTSKRKEYRYRRAAALKLIQGVAFGYFQESQVDFGLRLRNTAFESASGQLSVTSFPVQHDCEITVMIIKDDVG